MKTCPYCSEQIQDTAKKCRYCGERLEEVEKKANLDAGKNGNIKKNNKSSKVKKWTDADKMNQKRAGRKTFIMSRLYFFLDIVILGSIGWLVSKTDEEAWFIKRIYIIWGIITFVRSIFNLVYTININIKRWHDLGLSGWYMILQFIPIVGNITDLYLFIVPGDLGDNEYGPVENLEKTVEDIEREKEEMEEKEKNKKYRKRELILLIILVVLILIPVVGLLISEYLIK